MDELEKELKEGFLQEAMELLEGTEQAFLALEGDRKNADLLNSIFRFAHNLKGTSRAVGFGEVAEFTHELENLILKLKEGKIEVNDIIVSLLLESNDHIGKMIHGLKENLEAKFNSDHLLPKIRDAVNGKLIVTEEVVVEPVLLEKEETRVENDNLISSAALESLKELGIDINDLSFQEVSPVTKIETQKVEQKIEKKEILKVAEAPLAVVSGGENAKANTEETIRVGVGKISKLNDIVGELVIVQTVLTQMRYEVIKNELAVKAITQLSKLSKEIQEMSMGLCLVPIKSTFQKMTRIVRDTSKALNKKVELVIEGEDTEIDKTVLEHLGDPLVHIVRNAVDHGLESTEERLKAGKSEEGVIKIKAYHQGNNLAIEVSDDGKGINAEIIKRKAIEKNVISANASLSEKELINLVFHPGFSTKDQVSEVSGRGVGMDVVKNNITRLSGSVDINTVVGKGSVFKITLPLTMAIIDGMIVRVGNENFVIPLDHITESLSIKKESISTFTGVGECMNLRGNVYPLLKISQKLNLKDSKNKYEEQIAIIIRSTKDHYAIVVDDIIRQQQVVIKKIGVELKSHKFFMGSTILGDGRPAFIIDVHELFVKEEKIRAPLARAA